MEYFQQRNGLNGCKLLSQSQACMLIGIWDNTVMLLYIHIILLSVKLRNQAYI